MDSTELTRVDDIDPLIKFLKDFEGHTDATIKHMAAKCHHDFFYLPQPRNNSHYSISELLNAYIDLELFNFAYFCLTKKKSTIMPPFIKKMRDAILLYIHTHIPSDTLSIYDPIDEVCEKIDLNYEWKNSQSPDKNFSVNLLLVFVKHKLDRLKHILPSIDTLNQAQMRREI